MRTVTTYNGAQPRAVIKSFAWSYSRLKNFEACPKKHYHVDIAKDFREEEGEALQWGNAVHKAAAAYLSKGAALPESMKLLRPWCDKITGDGLGVILVEQQLAITKEFMPCEWFGMEAWFRSVADVLKLIELPNDLQVALALDWKTGKIVEDSVQLALMAACIFAHHPKVQRIRTEFIWLAHDAQTRADFSRDDMPKMWKGLWPRIEALQGAHNSQDYPPKPGGLCRRWCPVTKCPHHGDG